MQDVASVTVAGWLGSGLLFGVGAQVAAAVLVAVGHLARRAPAAPVAPLCVAATGAATALAWGQDPRHAVVGVVALMLVWLAVHQRLRTFSAEGEQLVCAAAVLALFAVPWTTWFVLEAPFDPLTRGLLLGGMATMVLVLPAGAVQLYESWEPLCRRSWTRPREAPAEVALSRFPRVALHVPVHAEPPDVVMATLDALAAIDYPALEVLVVDNNTSDPDLWRPVRDHCQRLGERFSFVHVEGLAGAKAGALNLALRHTDTEVELVGVIDADYHARSDFLTRLVGFFEDPQLGFVQTPHDYRGWEDSRYQRMCLHEYAYFFRTILPSRNERCAAITVGTMCLIRREALERAGGWAEWCVTEDSELAVRIHAAGYRSLYLMTSFGRGLIPETFAGYKRQRFRWTYGPVQELRRHWRLFLPRRWARPSQLTAAQKAHHLNHGLDRVAMGMRLALLPLGALAAASMVANDTRVAVPLEIWIAVTAGLGSNVLLRLVTYRFLVGCTTAQTVGALVASKALQHTVMTAALWGLVTTSIPWRRTDKFPVRRRGLTVLRSARPELALAALTLTGTVLVASLAAPQGVLLMLVIGGALQTALFLTAPAMALLADADRAVTDAHGRPEPRPTSTPALREADG